MPRPAQAFQFHFDVATRQYTAESVGYLLYVLRGDVKGYGCTGEDATVRGNPVAYSVVFVVLAVSHCQLSL